MENFNLSGETMITTLEKALANLELNELKKRERASEDDPEVVPLSKRMNNIHFDAGAPGTSCPMERLLTNNHNPYPVQNGLSTQYNDVHQNQVGFGKEGEAGTSRSNIAIVEDSQMSRQPSGKDISYAPVLGRIENPIYFESNRLLFELYQERLVRNGLPPHPNYCQ